MDWKMIYLSGKRLTRQVNSSTCQVAAFTCQAEFYLPVRLFALTCQAYTGTRESTVLQLQLQTLSLCLSLHDKAARVTTCARRPAATALSNTGSLVAKQSIVASTSHLPLAPSLPLLVGTRRVHALRSTHRRVLIESQHIALTCSQYANSESPSLVWLLPESSTRNERQA
jgi:hypothetical protein